MSREIFSRFVNCWTSAARQMCYNRKRAYQKEVSIMLTTEYKDFVKKQVELGKKDIKEGKVFTPEQVRAILKQKAKKTSEENKKIA
ncbi:hypothetical protein ZG96_004461 [Salmonella enterica subsp. enterica serovar Java]|nr:hypothetical protein [Salmonella enterica subsp. enterica serovar Java]EJC3483667.1 hypothetical protein [Salmonella enterica]